MNKVIASSKTLCRDTRIWRRNIDFTNKNGRQSHNAKSDTNLFSTNSSHSSSKSIHKDGKFVGLED